MAEYDGSLLYSPIPDKTSDFLCRRWKVRKQQQQNNNANTEIPSFEILFCLSYVCRFVNVFWNNDESTSLHMVDSERKESRATMLIREYLLVSWSHFQSNEKIFFFIILDFNRSWSIFKSVCHAVNPMG